MIMWYPCFSLQMHRCVQLLRWLFYCCMRWCTLSLALASSIYSSLYMALALPPLPIFLSPKIWDFWLLPMHVTYIFFEKKNNMKAHHGIEQSAPWFYRLYIWHASTHASTNSIYITLAYHSWLYRHCICSYLRPSEITSL